MTPIPNVQEPRTVDGRHAIGKPGEIVTLDMGTLGAQARFDVRQVPYCSFMVHRGDQAWPTSAVLTVKYGLNETDFYTVGTTVTMSALGITVLLHVKAIPFVCLEVTTAYATPLTIWPVRCYGDRG